MNSVISRILVWLKYQYNLSANYLAINYNNVTKQVNDINHLKSSPDNKFYE